MAEHEPCIGATDDWYTQRDIFDALGLTFDLDPCSPGPAHWVPARCRTAPEFARHPQSSGDADR